jgi:hypothetical protein
MRYDSGRLIFVEFIISEILFDPFETNLFNYIWRVGDYELRSIMLLFIVFFNPLKKTFSRQGENLYPHLCVSGSWKSLPIK